MADDKASKTGVPHMDPEAFRRVGHQLVDWVADYWDRVGDLPVRSQVQPGDVVRSLPDRAPEAPGGDELWADILRDVEEIIMPGMTHWQHPSFFAYFPANVSAPSVLGELLAAGLGGQGMSWQTSPAMTELEMRVLDWMVHALDLPTAFLSSETGGGVIQGTASEATLVALLSARARARREHPDRPDTTLVAYASEDAHSSVLKAAMIAGLAKNPEDDRQLRVVPMDASMGMRVDLLEKMMREDAQAGLLPFFVCATIGTTSATGVDPVDAIGKCLAAHPTRPWLHVDGAYAGVLALCPEHRASSVGMERADSFVVNAHKWLLTNFDCSLFWVKDRAPLLDALAVTPEYLRNRATESGEVIDYRDWQVPLGRRFRSLKLWFVLRTYGLEGLRTYLREHVAWATSFEGWVAADPRFEIVAPRTSALVCFRPVGEDRLGRALMESINASGAAYLTHTTVPVFDEGGEEIGERRFSLRLALGGARTRPEHVRALWEQVVSWADVHMGDVQSWMLPK